MSKRLLWYVRRGDQVTGPFPTQVVANNVLLGRFEPGDDVSQDRLEWSHLMEVQELMPPELLEFLHASDPERREWLEERLKAARRWADQRIHEDRRQAQDAGGGTRVGERRRLPVDRDVLALPHHHSDAQQGHGMRRHPWPALGIGGLVLAVVLGLLYFQPVMPVRVAMQPVQPRCSEGAAPRVDWSGCNKSKIRLRGADLSGSSLTYADFQQADLSGSGMRQASLVGTNFRGANLNHVDLSGADLSYADLRGASLVSARLGGAILDHAIWTDGRECARGSRGQCR